MNSMRDEIIARHIPTPDGRRQLAAAIFRPMGKALGFDDETVEWPLNKLFRKYANRKATSKCQSSIR